MRLPPAPRRRLCEILCAGLCLGLAGAAASAAEPKEKNLGKWEYENNCAVCHGIDGRGNGPLGPKAADLTRLAAANRGLFPFERLYQTIDGRIQVRGHGTREMPVWGNEYNERAIEYYRDFYRPYDTEAFIQGRILALISYIYEMQAK